MTTLSILASAAQAVYRNLTLATSRESAEAALENDAPLGIDNQFSIAHATQFLDSVSLIPSNGYQGDAPSGFAAAVFAENATTNNVIFAVRGTEPGTADLFDADVQQSAARKHFCSGACEINARRRRRWPGADCGLRKRTDAAECQH